MLGGLRRRNKRDRMLQPGRVVSTPPTDDPLKKSDLLGGMIVNIFQ